MKYRVLNPLLSVRKSTDKKSPAYEEFFNWQAGDVMTEWPEHTAITEWPVSYTHLTLPTNREV